MGHLPTEAEFEDYEVIRQWGAYNMIMDAQYAADAAGLDLPTYRTVQRHYAELRERYPEAIERAKSAVAFRS